MPPESGGPPSPRTVLMTADTVGGVWSYAITLCREFSSAGINVALATMGAPLSRSQRCEADAIANLQIYESDYKLEWMDDPWLDVRDAGAWLLELSQRLKPDLVHLNGYAHGDLPWNRPVVMVAHSCVLSWWHAVKKTDLPPMWNLYAARVTRGLRAADAVVAPSYAMLTQVERLYGVCSNCYVIYNGVDAKRFQPGVKENIVFSAGRMWDEAKNLHALDAAATGIDWPVLIAGELSACERSSTCSNNVKRLGQLDAREMASMLGKASIYALPARYEPFGLSVLEAALAGCALVLGNIASLREIWRDSAVYVSPDDPAELQSAINELIRAPQLRSDYAERARLRANTFTPAKMAGTYQRLYAHVLCASTREAKDSKASHTGMLELAEQRGTA